MKIGTINSSSMYYQTLSNHCKDDCHPYLRSDWTTNSHHCNSCWLLLLINGLGLTYENFLFNVLRNQWISLFLLAKMYLLILSSTSLYFHKTVIMRMLAEAAATLESSKSRVLKKELFIPTFLHLKFPWTPKRLDFRRWYFCIRRTI